MLLCRLTGPDIPQEQCIDATFAQTSNPLCEDLWQGSICALQGLGESIQDGNSIRDQFLKAVYDQIWTNLAGWWRGTGRPVKTPMSC